MEYLNKTINSAELSDIFEIPFMLRDKKVQVSVLPASDEDDERPKYKKRQLGFLKDIIPPLPDSFFDPLPEEDLQAWGL